MKVKKIRPCAGSCIPGQETNFKYLLDDQERDGVICSMNCSDVHGL